MDLESCKQKMDTKPCVILLSGKRKSGKDFLANKICERFEHLQLNVIRISAPIKKAYAELHNLDYQELLSDSPYKEEHRKSMIKWSEEIRSQQPGYFIDKSIENEQGLRSSFWLIPDIRRPSDIKHLEENLKLLPIKILIKASIQVREKRGFVFQKNVDDAPSECALDNYDSWDFVINNDGSIDSIEEALKFINDKIEKYVNNTKKKTLQN